MVAVGREAHLRMALLRHNDRPRRASQNQRWLVLRRPSGSKTASIHRFSVGALRDLRLPSEIPAGSKRCGSEVTKSQGLASQAISRHRSAIKKAANQNLMLRILPACLPMSVPAPDRLWDQPDDPGLMPTSKSELLTRKQLTDEKEYRRAINVLRPARETGRFP